MGGNKSLLFNTEYLVTIAGPERLVLFYDAAQVRDERQQFRLRDFRGSTGAEIRLVMPVLNVPFRLIFAANPQRAAVLDDNFCPAKAFNFRFAVGSTFWNRIDAERRPTDFVDTAGSSGLAAACERCAAG